MEPMIPPVVVYQGGHFLSGLDRNPNHLIFDDIDDIPIPTGIESSHPSKSSVKPIPEDLD